MLAHVLRHNTWANLTLLDFCREVDPAILDMTARGTYGTVYGTIQHLVRVLERLHGRPVDADRLEPATRGWAIDSAPVALIDRPWSRQELLAILRESDEQEATAECRAALWETHDAESHRAVQAWEERNPHEAERSRFVSMGEMMLCNCPGWVRHEMENLHDRVLRLRDRESPVRP